jgi:hypothetical protein
MTDEERALIADYLLKEGKKHIDQAGARSVDWYAKIFYELLVELDDDKAAALYAHYKELWGT